MWMYTDEKPHSCIEYDRSFGILSNAKGGGGGGAAEKTQLHRM